MVTLLKILKCNLDLYGKEHFFPVFFNSIFPKLEKDKVELVLFQKIESRMGKFHAVFGILKLSF